MSDFLAIALRETDLLAGRFVLAVTDPGGVAVGVDDHHVAHVDGRLLGDDAARGRTTLGTRNGGVLLDPVDALDQHLVAFGVGHQDLALGALVLTRDDEDGIALVHLHLQHLRGQRDDLHEALLAQLTTDGPEDAGATGVVVGLDDDGGVLVELDVAAIGAATLLDGAHHDGLDDLATLDVATGNGFLHRRHDDIADAGIAPRRATEHADAQDILGTSVVGDLEPRFLLNHSISSVPYTFQARRAAQNSSTYAVFVTEGHAGFSLMSACVKSI